jgi:hypothetical protein
LRVVAMNCKTRHSILIISPVDVESWPHHKEPVEDVGNTQDRIPKKKTPVFDIKAIRK